MARWTTGLVAYAVVPHVHQALIPPISPDIGEKQSAVFKLLYLRDKSLDLSFADWEAVFSCSRVGAFKEVLDTQWARCLGRALNGRRFLWSCRCGFHDLRAGNRGLISLRCGLYD